MVICAVAPLGVWKVIDASSGRKDIEAAHTGSLGPNTRNGSNSALILNVSKPVVSSCTITREGVGSGDIVRRIATGEEREIQRSLRFGSETRRP